MLITIDANDESDDYTIVLSTHKFTFARTQLALDSRVTRLSAIMTRVP